MSLSARIFNLVARNVIKPVFRRESDVARMRRSFRHMARFGFRKFRGVRVLKNTAPAGLRLLPKHGQDRKTILYFHGGGYIVGSPKTHQALVSHITGRTGVAAILPRYRLAPEHPFPAAFEDALSAWEAVIRQGISPDRIIIGGDSAGGGLALALLGHLCANGTPPAAAFAFSPWTDLALTGASLRDNAGSDVFFPADRVAELRDMVTGAADPENPRLSPLYAEFPNCPPVFLAASTTEILHDDTVRMAAHLRGFGADVSEDIRPDLPHVWPMFHDTLPEAGKTLDQLAEFIQRR